MVRSFELKTSVRLHGTAFKDSSNVQTLSTALNSAYLQIFELINSFTSFPRLKRSFGVKSMLNLREVFSIFAFVHSDDSVSSVLQFCVAWRIVDSDRCLRKDSRLKEAHEPP